MLAQLGQTSVDLNWPRKQSWMKLSLRREWFFRNTDAISASGLVPSLSIWCGGKVGMC